MAGKWVDFKEVKERIPIRDELERRGLLEAMKEKGDQLTGCCPIHGGSNERQFSVSTTKNGFQCFSGHCEAKGNVLDLVAALEGGISIRDAGLKLMEWFPERFAGNGEAVEQASKPAPSPQRAKEEGEATEVDDEVRANKPLTFELKLDPDHVFLHERGLNPDTIEHFGLGLASRGSMKGRIAIPIHDHEGELVAYAGRWVEADDELPDGEGKYKLPSGFHKSLVVYNLHRVPPGTKELIVVEGFFSVHWLHQNGYPNTVSLMGSSLSDAQLELLSCFPGVRLFLDGDEAGREATDAMTVTLSKRTWVRVSECPDGLQPDRLPAHELARLLK